MNMNVFWAVDHGLCFCAASQSYSIKARSAVLLSDRLTTYSVIHVTVHTWSRLLRYVDDTHLLDLSPIMFFFFSCLRLYLLTDQNVVSNKKSYSGEEECDLARTDSQSWPVAHELS